MTTHHFVNLTCWNALCKKNLNTKKRPLQHVFYCDSISLSYLSGFFGHHINVLSGTQYARNLMPTNNMLFLGSPSTLSREFHPVANLPFSGDISILVEAASLAIHKDIENVYIGISSPKQNLLAAELQIRFPHVDFYCLGAALGRRAPKGGFFPNWLAFLITSPRRTSHKLYLTLFEIISIFLVRSYRERFRCFCGILEYPTKT